MFLVEAVETVYAVRRRWEVRGGEGEVGVRDGGREEEMGVLCKPATYAFEADEHEYHNDIDLLRAGTEKSDSALEEKS